MKKRDLAILSDLQRFRCLTRDDIIDLHFSGLKNPITCCNTVLKRLRRDGQIEVNTSQQPYIYFHSPAPIKKDSAKIPHFLKIVEFYKSLLNFEPSESFIVEPKYGKGYMEPDAFMIWKRAPFFVEIQRSIYSEKVMNEKFRRYVSYYMSNEWQYEPWQPEGKKVFPKIILIADHRYNLPIHSGVQFFQVQDIKQFLIFASKTREMKKVSKETQGIKISIG
ncbi:replication-relaxation family protein [Peribacillus sp. TH16]|uniref:replication-relaxation family protein n=1 Tax=Peribacillus sp. TH16 TaxID=2798482 RepID=UPI001912B357|nr:replication-relaxation family protein [Peribacillus sp. TH16]MBK5483012.1 replication-relaxation family protein [Peribacillus sp. TH16]